MRAHQATPSASAATLLLATTASQSVLTEASAKPIKHLAWAPYGTRDPRQAPQSRSGFNGELLEQPWHWYQLGNGHRVYNPLLMRFHSPDRLSPFEAGGLNGYAYCAGDPVNFVDPSGNVMVLVQSFRFLLQKTKAFWSTNGGTVSSVLASQNRSAIAASGALSFPPPRQLVAPSMQTHGLSRSPSSLPVVEPSPRLSVLMAKAQNRRNLALPDPDPIGENRLWISGSFAKTSVNPPDSVTLSQQALKRGRFKLSWTSSALVRAGGKQTNPHRRGSATGIS